eukprot:3590495-Alexandrium_andersonii.AAC.1
MPATAETGLAHKPASRELSAECRKATPATAAVRCWASARQAKPMGRCRHSGPMDPGPLQVLFHRNCGSCCHVPLNMAVYVWARRQSPP